MTERDHGQPIAKREAWLIAGLLLLLATVCIAAVAAHPPAIS
jgi:hypothetical protein